MTTAIATKTQEGLTPSLPQLGLSLLNSRTTLQTTTDPQGGRRVEWVEPAPLTADERSAMDETIKTLRLWLEPGRRAVIVAMLARLANHRQKERTPQGWQMIFEDYCADIGEFSDAHVSEAIIEHRRTSDWFPSANQLRSRCLELRARDKFRLERARWIIDEKAETACVKNSEEPKSTVDISERLKDLATKMSTDRPSALHREESKPVTPAHAKTARAETNPAELMAALERRTKGAA